MYFFFVQMILVKISYSNHKNISETYVLYNYTIFLYLFNTFYFFNANFIVVSQYHISLFFGKLQTNYLVFERHNHRRFTNYSLICCP